MARVQYGAMITELIGSIGGTTFQSNRSGFIARTRSGTQKNITSKQTIAEALFTKWLQNWQDLTLAQQQVWDAFALITPKPDRFGTSKMLTGLNWYTSINVLLDTVAQAPRTTPPIPVVTAAWINDVFEASLNDIIIEHITSPVPAATSAMFFLTPPLKRTTTSFRRHLRLVHIINTITGDPVNLTTQWETVFGQTWPPAGKADGFKIGVMVVQVHNFRGISSLAFLDITPFTAGP